MEDSMCYDIQLPLNEGKNNRYYEMRLESIGGLGANLCGKLLGELGALYLGLNAASFSSYGSEKRGSPVKAFIRWSRREDEIRINSPVEHPDILGLFHEAMIGKQNVMAGVGRNTKVVVNTAKEVREMRNILCMGTVSERMPNEIYCVDAEQIAMRTKGRINMIMLGAICGASGFIPLDAVLTLAENTLGKKYPQLIQINLDSIRRGYEVCADGAKRKEGTGRINGPHRKTNVTEDSAVREETNFLGESGGYVYVGDTWNYQTAPRGGVIPIGGSTAINDLSASREGYIPLFLQDKCINCGLCDTTCPDMVFQFEPGEYRGKKAMVNNGLDYVHCKGCLRCVEVCPTGALVRGIEREHPKPEWNRRNKSLLVNEIDYDRVGANSYVTGEAYLQERRVDSEAEGGVV